MDKLIECRNKIDEIDKKIIELYEERMNVVKEVINYKVQNNMKIEDSNREIKMLEKNLNYIKNDQYKKYYENVLNGFLKASKLMQEEIIKK